MIRWQKWGLQLYHQTPQRLQRLVRAIFGRLSERGVGWDPHMTFQNPENYHIYKAEYDRELSSELDAAKERHFQLTGHRQFAGLNQFTPHRLYALIRDQKPTTVVETGVCNGSSSFVILAGLDRNEHGRLYSIDIPDNDRLPTNHEPGWIIPEKLRGRWSLSLGDSRECLSEVLSETETVDVFVHDTTSDILISELEIIWPFLDQDSIVIVDDVDTNQVYDTVLEKFSLHGGYLAPNVAVFKPLKM